MRLSQSFVNKTMLNIEKSLSPRLFMIADLVPKCFSVCDIGTDHAYVPIYLIQKGTAKKAIAADIKVGPLIQAEKNITLYGMKDKITTRLSDGFSNILENEADCVIIAGMGGETIASILKKDKGAGVYVLQMQTAHRYLRSYLCDNGYVIKKEAVCREGNKIYTALMAQKGEPYSLSLVEKEIGPYLLKQRPPLFYDYVRYRLYEIYSILKKMQSLEDTDEKKKHLLLLKSEYENLLKGEMQWLN